MTTLRQRLIAAAVVLIGALHPMAVEAQSEPPPSPAACAGWSRALATGGPGAQKALTEGWLAGCPSIGPDALAGAIARLRSSTDAPLLWKLAARSAFLQHPLILDAALQVATDRGATVEARAASLLILSGQLGNGTGIEAPPAAPRYGTILLTEAIPSTQFCGPSLRLGSEDDPAAEALPSDAERRVARVIDGLRTSTTEPARLRNLAQCLRLGIDREIPPQIDVGAVRLAYVCDNDFTVHNPTPLSLPFAFEVGGTTEQGEMTVHPGEVAPLSVESGGVVRLIYDGRVIQSTANGNIPCP